MSTGVRLIPLSELPIRKTFVYELEKQGKFPKRVKIGRRSFWRSDELEQWIEERTAASRSQG
jgi:prophage regulatory protein